MIPFVILQPSIRVSSPCTEDNDRVVCASVCSQEKQVVFYWVFLLQWCVYIRLLKVLFAVDFVGSSFSTGTASLSKTHVLSFHLSLVVCV